MKFATLTNKRFRLFRRPGRVEGWARVADRGSLSPHRGEGPAAVRSRVARHRNTAAFTLVEVLAALALMAIVIPVAVEALRISSLSGEVAIEKAVAMRVADNVLNESIVTTNWTSALNGTVTEGSRRFQWTLSSQMWQQDSAMELLIAEVSFSVGGRQYLVHLNTLANSSSTSTTMSGL